MSDKDGIARVDKPVQVTWRNRRVKTRENNDGVFFLVEMEVDEETWGFLKTIPRNANGEMVIWVTDVGMITEKPKKEPGKPKESKGPYGQLWRELYLSGFVNAPGVREAVEAMRETATEPAWEILHRVFGVGGASLAVIGPDDIHAKFPRDEFPAVKAMVEQAIGKVGVG